MLRWLFFFTLDMLFGDWQDVGVLVETVQPNRYYSAWLVYYHCFESRFGRRKVKIVVTKDDQIYKDDEIKKTVRGADIYQTKVYPWLKGRQNSEIPPYHLVKSKKFDFLSGLKGKDSVVLNEKDDG